MNIRNLLKQLGLVILVLGVAVGCASTPKEEPAPMSKGPSAAVTQAIAAAKSAMAKAKSVDGLWRDTGKILAKAEKAAADGDDATALKLANEARAQAELGYNQALLERAKPLLKEAAGYRSSMSSEQLSTFQAAQAAWNSSEGERSYNLISGLMGEMRAANFTYEVVRGDSLWGISGQSDVYGNPYQWPLIYKANSDQIQDADLIFPGQNFTIDRNPSASEVDAAVNHARTRGAWSVGPVEASDRAYLGY